VVGVKVDRSLPPMSYVRMSGIFLPFRGFMLCTGRCFLCTGSYAVPDQCGQHRQILPSNVLPFIYLSIYLLLFRLKPMPYVVHNI
jgi:hypothetical protein